MTGCIASIIPVYRYDFKIKSQILKNKRIILPEMGKI